jgi:hypothetical protein
VQPQRLAAALAALHGLKDLSLSVRYRTVALPALPAVLGTQLTKLQLEGVELSAAAMRTLPPSLADWEYLPRSAPARAPVDITHLSGLRRLSWSSLQSGDKLLPSLEWVQLGDALALEPLHPLTRLQSLRSARYSASLEQLQAAVAAIGPSLTALDVTVSDYDVDGRDLLSQRIAGPPILPLTGLSVRGWYGGSLAHLGQWTGLQRLSLAVAGNCDVPQLAAQLAQLTALQELEVGQWGSMGEASPRLENRIKFCESQHLQPLIDCIVGMASLRSFNGYCVVSDQQRAQLQAATQLTKLKLW